MRQDRWQLREHSRGKHCRRHSEESSRPEENYQRGDDEVRQDSDSSEGQIVPVVTGGGQNRKSVLPFLESHPPHYRKVWTKGNGDASQRRMMCCKRVLPFFPPFDTPCNVGSLVDGGIENVVGGHNAQHANGEKERKTNAPSCRTRQKSS